MATIRRDRLIIRAVLLGGLSPWMIIIFTLTLALHFQALTGHWPQPSLDDPKTLGTKSMIFNAHYTATLLTMPVAALSFLAPLLWLTSSRVLGARRIGLSAILLVVGWALIWTDPLHVYTWMLD